MTGDFNVTFDDRDVYDPDGWRDKILCSAPEREALGMDRGSRPRGRAASLRRQRGDLHLRDFRDPRHQRQQGLRIDHFLVSQPALAATGVEVDPARREGEKLLDHAPVILTLA